MLFHCPAPFPLPLLPPYSWVPPQCTWHHIFFPGRDLSPVLQSHMLDAQSHLELNNSRTDSLILSSKGLPPLTFLFLFMKSLKLWHPDWKTWNFLGLFLSLSSHIQTKITCWFGWVSWPSTPPPHSPCATSQASCSDYRNSLLAGPCSVLLQPILLIAIGLF